MQDAETKTLWNHITGEAVYGPLAGRSIGPVSNLLHMTVKQALEHDPDMRVAISGRRYLAGGRAFGTPGTRPIVGGSGASAGGGGRGRGGQPSEAAAMNERFATTLGTEDLRRPRMDLGLGVWTGTTERYYPMERIRERGEAFIDEIDGRRVLVYIDPEAFTPSAVYVEAARATREGLEIVLDDGSRVRAGVLIGPDGRRRAAERPQQMFTRWYGFALTFPGCEIFGG